MDGPPPPLCCCSSSSIYYSSHPSGDVFAMGDIAKYPLPLLGGGEGGRLASGGYDHAQNAREMASHIAKVFLRVEGLPPLNTIPYYYSRFNQLSWKFYGVNEGKVVVVGGVQQFEENRTFGAFWIRVSSGSSNSSRVIVVVVVMVVVVVVVGPVIT